jgi:hypothetical protein
MRIVEILGKCGAEVGKNIGVVREATGAELWAKVGDGMKG